MTIGELMDKIKDIEICETELFALLHEETTDKEIEDKESLIRFLRNQEICDD
jgi:hypothetical protein